jgi:hypothetical protein
MSADTTQMMHEALQAAVTRLNGHNGSAEPRAAPPDTIGTLLSFVPKLLQNNEAGGQMLDKLDALQKGDLTSLRGDVQILRRQCFRVFKSQEQLLTKLGELEKQQAAIGHAVLELANQLARITFVGSDGDDDSNAPPDRDEPRPDLSRNNRTATRQDGRGKRRQSTAAGAGRGGSHDR